MFTNLIQEEIKLDAMQRAWQPGFCSPSRSLYDANNEFTPFSYQSGHKQKKGQFKTPPNYSCSDIESDDEFLETKSITRQKESNDGTRKSKRLLLNASDLGDIPARYVVHPVESHQLPVCGVYVDKRIVPGFKYRVRPLLRLYTNEKDLKCLFDGKALVLESIGRGYSRRFTFEADRSLSDNDNYFWSDNRPEGYAFELEVASEGDKFTVFDVNGEAQATAEVMKLEDNQIEIGNSVDVDGTIVKTVKVKLTVKVEFFEYGVAKPIPISGIAICVKKKGEKKAEVKKIIHVNIKHHRYYLTPGFQNGCRRVTVRGDDINDVPTKYTMTGLESYEIPVVGTYVDPRVIPGFHYKVRPNDRKHHLFSGQSLKLESIGIGYSKRLTFESPSKINPTNYLWSDNHPDGLGLEPRAVLKEMKFKVLAGDREVGEAVIFRDDMPQMEESMEKVKTPSGKYAIVKYIQIDVICHIKLETNDHLMRVWGLAVVRKDPDSNEAKVLRVENVGLDSQLNVLFVNSHTDLTFVPSN